MLGWRRYWRDTTLIEMKRSSTTELPALDFKTLAGKRCLFRHYTPLPVVQEFVVAEVSPSGMWVQLRAPNNEKFWTRVTNVELVVLLPLLVSTSYVPGKKHEDGRA